MICAISVASTAQHCSAFNFSPECETALFSQGKTFQKLDRIAQPCEAASRPVVAQRFDSKTSHRDLGLGELAVLQGLERARIHDHASADLITAAHALPRASLVPPTLLSFKPLSSLQPSEC